MRNCIRVLGLCIALSALLIVGFFEPVVGTGSAQAQSRQARTVVIRQIVVQGNQRIEAETVRSYMEITVGDTYDPAKVNRSLKALFRTGLFSDVRIFRQVSILVVRVVENPIINRVNFEGNKELKDKALRKEVQLRARVVFTTARAQKDVERIVTVYRRTGRFAARVVPKIIRLPQNRVDLIYEISEGPETSIARINFVGNRAFSDSKLRSVITTAESAWWKFFSRSDNYDPDRLNFDRELLRRHYLKNGFADFRVISAVAELARDGTSFFITFTVEEGEQYTFGRSEIATNLPELNPARLDAVILTEPGKVYDASKVDKTIDALTAEVGKTGFAFARVKPKINRDRENRIIHIVYTIQEGPRVYIERIDIIGNLRTLDRVIRRELRLAEGDAYNRVLVDRARRRITALDFFSKVEIKQSPGSAADKVILTLKVVEKSTGSLSFGAGFSTSESILGDVSVTERNFLGKGQFVRLRTSLSFKRQQLDFKFTEPYFLGRKMTFGVDAFATETDSEDESSFESRQLGGGVRFGFPLSEDSALSFRYLLSYDKIFNVDAATASPAVVQAQGSALTSLIGVTWAYDTLDSRVSPTKGVRVTLTQDFAGVGGDVYYSRTVGRAIAFYPIYFENLIGAIKTSAGYITGWNGRQVRILDRFFKGGDSLRGFERAGIGPRDTASANQDALGGKIYAISQFELTFPIGLPPEIGIRGGLFADIGTLFDSPTKGLPPGVVVADDASLRASAGVSVLWKSPLGPIRLDFAHAFLKKSYDKTEIFRFSGGTSF
jgi:outer membrane protein insertion porin family